MNSLHSNEILDDKHSCLPLERATTLVGWKVIASVVKSEIEIRKPRTVFLGMSMLVLLLLPIMVVITPHGVEPILTNTQHHQFFHDTKTVALESNAVSSTADAILPLDLSAQLTGGVIAATSSSLTEEERLQKLAYDFNYDILYQDYLLDFPELPPDDFSQVSCGDDEYRIEGTLLYFMVKDRPKDAPEYTRPLVWATVKIHVVYAVPGLGYVDVLWTHDDEMVTNRNGEFMFCIPQSVKLSSDVYKLTITVRAGNDFVGGIYKNPLTNSILTERYEVTFGPFEDLSDDFTLPPSVVIDVVGNTFYLTEFPGTVVTFQKDATEDAFRLYSAIAAGWSYIIDVQRIIQNYHDPGPVVVVFPFRPLYHQVPPSTVAIYHVDSKYIYIFERSTARYPFVILHEYGHHVFTTAFVPPLSIGGQMATEFNEGFSSFFALSVLDDPRPLEGGEMYDGTILPERERDFESEVLQLTISNLPESLDLSQDAIAKILWDFSDDSPFESVTTTFVKGGLVKTTSTLDQVALGFDGTWKIIKHHYQTPFVHSFQITLEYFWNSFMEMFPSETVRKACTMMSLHYVFPSCEPAGSDPYLSSSALILSSVTEYDTEILLSPILDVGSPLNAGPYLVPDGHQWTVIIDQWDPEKREWTRYREVKPNGFYHEERLVSSFDYRITVEIPSVAGKIAGITKQVVIKHYSPPPPPCSPIKGCQLLPFASIVNPSSSRNEMALSSHERATRSWSSPPTATASRAMRHSRVQ